MSRLKKKKWRYFNDVGALYIGKCSKVHLKTKPDAVEEIVFNAMRERLNALEIIKYEHEKPDADAETLKADIIRLNGEIQTLLDKLIDADTVLFDYIQKRVNSLHNQKADLEEKLQTRVRKRKKIDTAPLKDPMSRWNSLSVEERHALAVVMIETIYVSDTDGIDIKFNI